MVHVLSLLIAVLRWLAVRVAPSLTVSICRRAGRLSRFFCKREREIADAQLRYFLSVNNLTQFSIATLGPQVFGHVGELVGESLIIDKLIAVESETDVIPTFRHISISGLDELRAFRDLRSPALVLSAHLGCFELLAACMIRCGFPIATFARTPNYAFLERLLTNIRGAYGLKIIWRNDKVGNQQLLRLLRQNSVIAALIDQDTHLVSRFIDFFGLPAAYPKGILRTALVRKLPIATAFIVRTKPLTHQIVFQSIAVNDLTGPDAIQRIFEIYSERLEKLIIAHPEQWIWWHRRWRRRPGVDYVAHPELLPETGEYLRWLETQRPATRESG